MSGAPNDFPSLKPGSHVCLPYGLATEKHGIIAGFVRDGLLHGERCLYWGQASDFAALTPNLEAMGVQVPALLDRGSLVFADMAKVSAQEFDPSAELALMREAVKSARGEGYAGLRVASDPDAKTRSRIDPERLALLESVVSQLCEDLHATWLCAFEQSENDSTLLEVALATHEVAIIAGQLCANPYFKNAGQDSGLPSGPARAARMAANILESARARDLLEAESAALIVENSRSDKRDAEHRRQIAALSRAVEARDRLIVTAARWLSRPMPVMCSHLKDLANDPRLQQRHAELETCDEHLAAVTRLSRGLDEIASFLQLQVVLRPEELDLVEVARAALDELGEEPSEDQAAVDIEGAAQIVGTWDRLRLTRLFYSLIRTAREQGYDARIHLRFEDLLQFVRVRFEFMLPHAPSLSESGERLRSLDHGAAGESDYERLAVQLWPSREIVRMMGGTLGISTWADARVIFTLDLPKSVAAMKSEDEDSSPLQTEPRSSRQ
jgi:hypothetical protein